jgi:TonB family protein
MENEPSRYSKELHPWSFRLKSTRSRIVKSSTMRRRICDPAKRLLIGSLTLICVSCLPAEEVKRVSSDEAMKAVTSKTKPEYDIIARKLKLSGPVSLDVTIAEDGTVETVVVVSGNPVLARLATTAMKQWKFTPFKSDGKAIKVIAEIDMKFNYI